MNFLCLFLKLSIQIWFKEYQFQKCVKLSDVKCDVLYWLSINCAAGKIKLILSFTKCLSRDFFYSPMTFNQSKKLASLSKVFSLLL